MTAEQPEVLEAEVPAIVQVVGNAEVDVQISTAKRFPRSIAAFKRTAMEMACLDEETAEACFYALPRGGKTIEGPSARFAEICMTAWGNSRVEAKQVGEDERFVTSRGTAWDLQTNVAVAFEVKRRITTSAKKEGGSRRFDDDMIGVTSNAASSIALRNSVLKMIPAAFWRPIYIAARHAAVGDIKTLATRRAEMLAHYQKLGATNDQVFGLLEVKGADDITLDHMVTLKGLATALKEGETTFEEVFAGVITPIRTPERKSDPKASSAPAPIANQSGETTKPIIDPANPAEPDPEPQPEKPAEPTNPAPLLITKAEKVESSSTRGKSDEEVKRLGKNRVFFFLITDSTKRVCSTWSEELYLKCGKFADDKTPVDMNTETVSGQQWPRLLEVTAVK